MNSLTSDLDIVNYFGKWRDARRLAAYKYGSRRDGYFWRQVRVNFLALGGQYLQANTK